ncbi:hypothetical protein GGP41_009322 [Bipolaris sorokiniana]|uniref:Uncharacterized protein n=1 Tax=Cochliobolus sativus TaxID=45130 RepID=A0A8H6DVK9_COCSA|nr:hypothetical protein GGP41_009322 [Bipolaris sorokiniana]
MQGVRGKCLALRLETRAQAVKPALPHRLCWTAGRLLSKKIDMVATRSKIPIQICPTTTYYYYYSCTTSLPVGGRHAFASVTEATGAPPGP